MLELCSGAMKLEATQATGCHIASQNILRTPVAIDAIYTWLCMTEIMLQKAKPCRCQKWPTSVQGTLGIASRATLP